MANLFTLISFLSGSLIPLIIEPDVIQSETDAQCASAAEGECVFSAGLPSDRMGKQTGLKKIEELRHRLQLTHENASRYQLELESLARAAANDRAWAKEELGKKMAHIQRLEAENNDLRRRNVVIRQEIHQTKQVYRKWAKRIKDCNCCMQSLDTADESLPAVPTETESEIRQFSETLLLEDLRIPYLDSSLCRGVLSSLSPAGADTGTVTSTGHPASLIGETSKLLSAPLPIDTTPSETNSSSFFTDASPNLTSRETQPSPVSSCGISSPVGASGLACSIAKGRHDENELVRQTTPLTFRPEQLASSEQNLHLEHPWVQSPLAHGHVARSPIVLSEANLLAVSTPQRYYVNDGDPLLPRASSDVSMHSAPEPREEDRITAEVDSDKEASANLRRPSQNGSHEDSSDVDPDADEQVKGGAYLDSAGREGSKAPEGHQRADVLHCSNNRNHAKTSEKCPSKSHHRKGPAGHRLDGQLASTKARTTVLNARSGKACSFSAAEKPSASRNAKPRASHQTIALRSPSLTMLESNTQARPTRSTSPAPSPAAATEKQGQNTRQGEEENDTDLKIAIRESYARFALTSERLRFCYEPQTLDPFSINLNTNWKRRSKLNESAVEKLLQMGSEIATFLPESDTEKATKKELALIRRLCRLNRPQTAYGSLREVVGALRRERDVTKDELNLIEFEIYSTLIVMKSQSESEFEETVTAFSDYQCNLLGMYNSLHTFLAHLNEAWEGLHLLLVIYLLRVGTGRLVKYFVPTTRAAAIELLLHRFEKPELMAKHRTRLYHLLSLSGTTCTSHIRETTPMKRLQDRMGGVIEPHVARAALGYTSQYQRDTEVGSSRPQYSTPNSVLNDPMTVAPSTGRPLTYNALGEQYPAVSSSERHSPNIETLNSTPIAQQSGLRKSLCIDDDERAGKYGNRPARKRRYGIGRLDDHDTGQSFDDAATPLLEGPPERSAVQSPMPRQSGAEIQGDSPRDNDAVTEAVDNLCASLHMATDLGSPWSQTQAAPIDGYMDMQAVPQGEDAQDYLAEATGRSPSLHLYGQWRSNAAHPAQHTNHQKPVTHWKSRQACLPQEVIDSVENGTVDPRALNLR